MLDKTGPLRQVSSTIADFNLLEAGEEVVVAFSGGKDSAALCILLKELGFNVSAITVDMHYEANFSVEAARMAAEIGIDIHVVDVHQVTASSTALEPERDFLRNRLSDLAVADMTIGHTPCTYCYNSKMVAISVKLRELGKHKITFGHHRIDALSSLIKSALMYYDSQVLKNTRFDRKRFALLVDNQFDSPESLLSVVREAVRAAKASTDEPPRETTSVVGRDCEIIRPLFGCDESDLASYIAELGLKTQGSGCGHGQTKLNYTPREMVRARLLELARNDSLGVVAEITRLMLAGIDPQGYAALDARRLRTELLGQAYKPALGGVDKL